MKNNSTLSIHPAEMNRTRHVAIELKELLDVVATAKAAGRAWVDDFGDEPIRVSQDLYEVIRAARAFAR